jgi:hypothetical protein
MNHSSTLRAGLITGALLLAATLAADTLVLRDGRRIQGQLIAVRDGVVEFQEGLGGRVGRVNRDDVFSIEFGRAQFDRNDRNDRNDAYNQGQRGRPRGLRERQMMVVANVAWTDTNIDVSSGQNLYFESSGEIRWGPNRRAGPAGEGNSPNNPSRPMPNRAGGSLIGRVGDSRDYFFIGADTDAIRMRGSGRLYLGINDDNLQDNSGYFTVIVYH